MYKYMSQKTLKTDNKSKISLMRNVISPKLQMQTILSPFSVLHHHNQQGHSTEQLKHLHSMNSMKSMKSMKSTVNTNNQVDFLPITKMQSDQEGGNVDLWEENSNAIRAQFKNLRITLQLEGHSKQTVFFYFNRQTRCFQLRMFLHQKIARKGVLGFPELFYYESPNFHLDYFLTIPNAKVSQIPTDAIFLRVRKLSSLNIGYSLKIFEIIKCIGSGGFSKVFLARAYGILMAIKVIPKQFILQTGKQSIIQNERFILQNCGNHPFVTKLYMSFQTEKYVIFGMEYCNGGELFNLLRKVKRMKQQQAKFYFLQTLSAISYLHSQRVVYRDIKPQNIILDFDGHIRLADYGLSKIMNQQRTYSFCGSAEYMAPQMLLRKGHSYEIDFYCLGALLYQLVTGLPPYYSRDQKEQFANIIAKDLTFPQSVPISKSLKQLLLKLLSKNSQERFNNIYQIFTYQWLAGYTLKDIQNKNLVPPFKTSHFDYNFDDSEFIDDEERQMRRLQLEKENSQIRGVLTQNFLYESQDIKNIRLAIQKGQARINSDHKKNTKSLAVLYQPLYLQNNLSTQLREENEDRSNSKIYLPKQSYLETTTIQSNNYLKKPSTKETRTDIRYIDQREHHKKLVFYGKNKSSKQIFCSLIAQQQSSSKFTGMTLNPEITQYPESARSLYKQQMPRMSLQELGALNDASTKDKINFVGSENYSERVIEVNQQAHGFKKCHSPKFLQSLNTQQRTALTYAKKSSLKYRNGLKLDQVNVSNKSTGIQEKNQLSSRRSPGLQQSESINFSKTIYQKNSKGTDFNITGKFGIYDKVGKHPVSSKN